MNFPWEQKHIDYAVEQWRAGKSAATIAHELGASRSAVLGKLNRLGELRSNNTPYKVRVRRMTAAALERRRLERTAVAKQRGAEMASTLVDWTPGEGKHLLDLTPTCCRWPLWPNSKIGTSKHFFCGNPTETKPYCPGHTSIAKTNKFEAPAWT